MHLLVSPKEETHRHCGFSDSLSPMQPPFSDCYYHFKAQHLLLMTLSLSEHLQGVPAHAAMHPWQCGSSQRPGWWGPDGQAVGPRFSLPAEDTTTFTGGSGGHGAEEVAGT